jgi:hypothetical protein
LIHLRALPKSHPNPSGWKGCHGTNWKGSLGTKQLLLWSALGGWKDRT